MRTGSILGCTPIEGDVMGLDDKISNKAEELGGKAKEAAGDATDNKRLEAEGEGDQGKAGAKQAGENLKDALDGR